MTAVGKILVFVNLLFSLAVGAFVVMIYVARTHWVDEYNKLRQQHEIALADAKTYRSEAEKAQKDADARIAKTESTLKKVQGDLESQVAENAKLRQEKTAMENRSLKEVGVSNVSLAEVQKRQADVEQMRKTLQEETAKTVKLSKDNYELRQAAVTAQVQAKAVLEMNKRLEAQMQEMARDMARSRSGGGTTTARLGGKNPPPDDVQGLVRQTDPSGLVTLSIGSDAGLATGQTLEAYRLSPVPSQSKYLGTLRILDVTANTAVAQPVGRLAAPLKVGDTVASRIGS
jgi:hypothetical protein